jgi:DNA-binding NarL/FixJ family response regulator
MIRIILFDDSKGFRKSLTDFFNTSDDIYAAAGFDNARDAARHVKEYNPDVVLMDIQMPGKSGLEALQDIQVAAPGTKVLMLTSFDDDDKIFAALCNSAFGYVLKSSSADEIHQAIVEVHQGGRYLTPSLAAKVYRLLQNQVVQTQTSYVPLTDRQKEVLQAMVDGLSRKMIADKLGIHIDTVGDHVKEIYRKLHVNSAPEAVREAIQKKII